MFSYKPLIFASLLFFYLPAYTHECCDYTCDDSQLEKTYSHQSEDGASYRENLYDEAGNLIRDTGTYILSPAAAAGEYATEKGSEAYDYILDEHEKWNDSEQDVFYDQEQDIDYWRAMHDVPREGFVEEERKKEFIQQRQDWINEDR